MDAKTSMSLAAATALILLAGSPAAEAGTHLSVGIGLGVPGYYGGGHGPGYYGGGYYAPCPPYGYGYGYGACGAPYYGPPIISFGFYGGHGGWRHHHHRHDHDWHRHHQWRQRH